MLLFGLLFIPIALTCVMFISRQAMLGFPSAIFWAIFGAYSYTLSAVPWGDVYFYLFFASMFGMTTFTMFAAYGLREKKDVGTDENEFVDEKGEDEIAEQGNENDEFEPQPSRRTLELRERAKRRRDGERTRKKIHWGGFR